MVSIRGVAAENFEKRWEDFRTAAEKAAVAVPTDPETLALVRAGFAFSDFVAQSCIRRPTLLDDLFSSGDLQQIYDSKSYVHRLEEALAGVESETALAAGLRRQRCREMVRIACRDLAGASDLEETLADLTHLADACILQALKPLTRWQCERYGTPLDSRGRAQHLAVLAMGKLGAGELNFSSDIDLLFAFAEPGQTTAGHPIDDFFVRLSRQLIKILNEKTADGFVFRVDTNLRPFGESGPLVMSFDAMESYYQSQGREWERYALIKARSVVEADSPDSGAELLQRLKPFVYRRYLDFGVFESLREMKQKISREVKSKGLANNIKLGPGGIREIEFFGQIFQLIRGGVVPVLQARGIREILGALVEEKLVPATVCDELLRAYHFLRRLENRLQSAGDQQTHALPQDPQARSLLAGAMGFDSADAFDSQLDSHCRTVHHHFMGLLEAPGTHATSVHEEDKTGLQSVWQEPADAQQKQQALTDAGFDDPAAVLSLLDEHRASPSTRALSGEGRRRLDRLVPSILIQTGAADQSTLTLQRILEVVQTIQRRTSYLSLLLENPTALVHLVRLTAASPWITHFLSNHPVLLDELLDPRNLYVPSEPGDMQKDLQRRLAHAPAEDLEHQIEELCIFKQVNTLRVAAADVTGVLALMRVSDYLTDIATTILHQVIDMAWTHLVARHGTPHCRMDGKPLAKGFSVIGYGKLGGLELGYGSDLDLVFLHAGTQEMTVGGSHPIDTLQFFSRLGQRVIHILTAHTPAGRLYEVDMRLRPDGGGGLLVSHVDTFADYQKTRARTWEHQALVRARPISGDERIANRFNRIRGEILSRRRKKALLNKEVGVMRSRLRRESLTDNPSIFNIKQGPGGIVDIEFLVQYLVLLCSHQHPDLLVWTDNVRILQTLVETGVMDNPTADFLKHAYLILRAYAHKLSLQEKPAEIPAEKFVPIRRKVQKIWASFFGKRRIAPAQSFLILRRFGERPCWRKGIPFFPCA